MPKSSAQAWVVALIITSLVVTSVRTSGWLPRSEAGSPEVPESVSPSPIALASQYMQLDVHFLRWLWWPMILYLFWGMAYVCDEYFVRTIDVISERFQIPEDVAGATLMALGCNGPEMALNTIAIFHPSSIGVGAVIGGEVFNVLVIIGTALLATPAEYLPLQLGPFSFCRDVLFYLASLGLLYWVLQDGTVTRVEAAVLLSGALLYTVTVALSSRLGDCCLRLGSRLRRRSSARRTTRQSTSSRPPSRRSWTQAMTAATQELSSRPPNRRSWTQAVVAAMAAAKAAAAQTEAEEQGKQRRQRRQRRPIHLDVEGSGSGSESGAELESESETEFESESEFEYERADPEMVAQWSQSRACTDPCEGSVLSVRVDVRNRLMDRGHRAEERYICLLEDALLVSTAWDPLQRATPDQIPHAESCRSCRSEGTWHRGGLVNRPVCLFLDTDVDSDMNMDMDMYKDADVEMNMGGKGGSRQEGLGCCPTPMPTPMPRPMPKLVSSLSLERFFSATPISQLARPLLNAEASKRQSSNLTQAQPAVLRLHGFREAPWEVIPLRDVLYCQAAGEERSFTLHVHQHDNELGNLITLEMNAKEAAVAGAWMACLSEALRQQRRGPAQAQGVAWSCSTPLREWLEWLQFPVKSLLRLTIPNMDDPMLQHWYPMAFLMSMAWLALFAYSVVAACDGIHADFGISVNVLGFTVAAAGTSFPNVFSGMVVARQGKTSMAVANALGANVQNVFLALAVPWTVQTWLIRQGPFTLVVSNLLPAIVECLVTLVPVMLVYVLQGSSLPRWAGCLFLAEYLVYLIVALGEESSGCATWPLPC